MVLDAQLQDGSGVQVCRDVRSVHPSISGVLLTSTGDVEALILSVLAGAAGAVGKLSGTHDIVETVRRVRPGKTLRDHVDTERAADHLRARAEDFNPTLTPRQVETLSLVLAGQTDQRIAEDLYQPLASLRDEVAQLITRLTTYTPPADKERARKAPSDPVISA